MTKKHLEAIIYTSNICGRIDLKIGNKKNHLTYYERLFKQFEDKITVRNLDL